MGTSYGSITIIADDLTGACDAVVPFAAAGEMVRVGLGDRLPAANEMVVRAMSTNTRDVPAGKAAERIRELTEEVGETAELFKKIDSVFRGNTAVEICAAVRHWSFDLAVIAPAYPALGRTVRDGVLWIEDAAGKSSVRIVELLAEAGARPRRIAAGSKGDVAAVMHRALIDGTRLVLCDAVAQSDLDQVVHAARSTQKRVLWIGSGGLAHALAAEDGSRPEVAERRRGRVVYFVGSPHGVTSAQVEHLRSTERLNEGGADFVVKVELGKTAENEIRQAVAGLTAESIGCLFMTGGDTALFVCRALGVGAIRLEREFAAGVPLGTAEGGRLDGVTIALKSGGFGEVDLMRRLLERFGVKQEVTA